VRPIKRIDRIIIPVANINTINMSMIMS